MRNPRQNVDGGYETVRQGLSFHQRRHRNIGDAHWVEVHLIFPKRVSLEEAHRTATAIERTVEEALEPRAYLTTHPNARRAMMNFIQTAIVEKQVERAAASADEHARRSAKGSLVEF